MLVREKKKAAKYARLISVADRQFYDGGRATVPTFSAFVVSDSGMLSPQALKLQEWIIAKYKKRCKRQFRTDGTTTKELVKVFRQKLRIQLQLAIAAGVGGMMVNAGRAFRGLGRL